MRPYREWIIQSVLSHSFRKGAEIGSRKGRTVDCILSHHPGTHMYAVEPFEHIPESPGSDRYKNNKFDKMKSAFDHICGKWVKSGRCKLFQMPSWEAAEMVSDHSLDFVFIDGDHSYEGVYRDIQDWYYKVRPGGKVIGHDISLPGVHRAVAELIPNYRIQWSEDLWHIENIGRPDAYNNIILEDKKIVFCLNEKAGITSIKRMTQHDLGHMIHRKSGDARTGLRYIHRDEIPLLDSEYTVIAVVRHPVDRLISCYYDKVLNSAKQQIALRFCPDPNEPEECIKSAHHDEERREKINAVWHEIRNMSIAEFIDKIYHLDVSLHDPHFQAQHHTLPPNDEIDFTIRLENFNEDWKELKSSFNLNLPKEVSHRNAGKHPGREQVLNKLSDEDIGKMYKIYEKDYEKLGDYYV